ncbi:synaptotagmin-15-like [Saccostrea echinata]|uniref:synaptotagmin-15-like n=1 Tax=Saccostrea echinata TaxID=191078 RepID=UPI002A7FA6F5|nr:synaptotagmin-15-like [Saccostrea echinata]
MGVVDIRPTDEGGGTTPHTTAPGPGLSTVPPWYKDNQVLVTIGCVSGVIVFVIFLIISVLVCRSCKKRRKWKNEWDESNLILESKSAPISRNPSPKPTKRKSCPDVSPDVRGIVVRSMTIDNVPDFSLPPERVQPRNSYDSIQSPTKQHTTHSFVGHVQPDLYKCPNYSDEESLYLQPSEHGRLWFSVLCDVAVEQLHVTLVKVRELPGRGRDNSPRDPFVKIFLLPDERNCKVSKVRRKTLAPVYNESFTFQISPDQMKTRVLRFSVYDVDKRRVRHSLGHILVPLQDIDLTKGDLMYRDLELNSQVHTTMGEINIGLTYLPSVEKIKVVIIKAKNLRQIDIDQNKHVFVRIQMVHGRKVCKTKNTMHHRASTEPTFNESFSFSVSGKTVDTCSFEISLMTSTKTPFSHDEIYGKTVIGSFMFARGNELLHWQEMINHPRSSVVKWHQLSGVTHHT